MIKKLLILSLLISCSSAIAQQEIRLLKFVDSVYVEAYREYETLAVNELYKITDKAVVNNKILEIFISNENPSYSFRKYGIKRTGKSEIYYIDGSLKARKNFNSKGKLNGEVSYYEPDGKVQSRTLYENGKAAGTAEHYKDGKLELVTYYDIRDNVDSLIKYYPNGNRESNELILKAKSNSDDEPILVKIAHWTIDGEKVIENGNGDFISKDSVGRILEEGTYENGRKEGIWKGTVPDLNVSYVETYKNGTLIEGVTIDSLGNKLTYDKSMMNNNPKFKTGISGLYKFIGGNLKYPAEALRGNIHGVVQCRFLVDTNGKIPQVQITQGVHPSLDEAAKTTIKSMSGLWIPKHLYGQPVEAYYTLPIIFRLD